MKLTQRLIWHHAKILNYSKHIAYCLLNNINLNESYKRTTQGARASAAMELTTILECSSFATIINWLIGFNVVFDTDRSYIQKNPPWWQVVRQKGSRSIGTRTMNLTLKWYSNMSAKVNWTDETQFNHKSTKDLDQRRPNHKYNRPKYSHI